MLTKLPRQATSSRMQCSLIKPLLAPSVFPPSLLRQPARILDKSRIGGKRPSGEIELHTIAFMRLVL
jgi:hypothetical protein